MTAEIPLFGNNVFCFALFVAKMTGKKPGNTGGTAFDNYIIDHKLQNK